METTCSIYDGRVSSIVAAPKHPVDAKGKYLGPNLLHGLEASAVGPWRLLLKLDADSLLIGPFSEGVGTFLASHPHCGVCGTLGRTSAREHKTYGYELRLTSPLVQMIRSSPPAQWRYISSLSERVLLDYAKKGNPP